MSGDGESHHIGRRFGHIKNQHIPTMKNESSTVKVFTLTRVVAGRKTTSHHDTREDAELEAGYYRQYAKNFNVTLELSEIAEEDLDYSFKLGDKATYTIHTDSHVGYVVKVSPNGKTVWVAWAEAKLLNGANSGEEDALRFQSGGFIGHTSGEQRWEIADEPNPGEGTRFSFRGWSGDGAKRRPIWKRAGHGTRSPGCTLCKGHYKHYDFNY